MTTANAAPSAAPTTPPASFTRPADLSHLSLGDGQAIIRLSLIDPSPFNPRKTFDKADDAELDASIKEVGLLENLIVRAKAGGRYELMGGERRYRSCKRLKIEEVPCTIRKADDGQAIALQIVENLQRKDLPPLEEAEAFATLQAQDPKTWTAAAIAKTIGKTDRFVQQRISIANGLSAPLKEKFSEGDLTVEAARTLASFPVAVQKQIPEWAVDRGDAGDLRRHALELCIPEAAAKFDVTTYKGEWIEDGKGKKYFADVAQFMKLQKPAAEKKRAEVEAEWPGAQLIADDEAGKLFWADETYAPYGEHSSIRRAQRDGDKPRKFAVPKEKCQAVVWIAANGQVRKALGVCTANAITTAAAKRQASSQSANSRMKSPAGEKADHKKERLAFNAAVLKAATKDKAFSDRLLVFLALNDDLGLSYPEVNEALPAALVKLRPEGYQTRGADEARLWEAIAKLPPAEARRHAEALLLAAAPSWADYDHRQKPLLMVAVAQSLGVTPPAIALPEPPNAKPGVKAKAKKPATKKKAARK